VRIKAIVVGAVGALALATLTANAGTSATRHAPGSVLSLVAATTTVTRAVGREAETVATRNTTNEEATEPSEKPEAPAKPAAPRPLLTVSVACQQAINNLKALHQADLTEDAAERAAAQQPLSAAGILADRAEDQAEAQRWKQALMAVRTACLPQPTAACQAALAALEALLPANRPEEWSDLVRLPNQIDLTALRAAFTAVVAACGDRD
jgi:hypothetical protein